MGYAIANTPTSKSVGLPCLDAVIVGDFVAGGLATVLGCFTGISAYPINW